MPWYKAKPEQNPLEQVVDVQQMLVRTMKHLQNAAKVSDPEMVKRLQAAFPELQGFVGGKKKGAHSAPVAPALPDQSAMMH